MSVRSIEEAEAVIHDLCLGFEPSQPKEIPQSVRNCLYSRWERSSIYSVLSRLRSRSSIQSDRLLSLVEKVDALVHSYPALCSKQVPRQDLHDLYRSFSKAAEPIRTQRLTAALNRFQITILGGIADVDEAEPSMYSDWLEGDQGLIALLRHSLVQQNHLLTHQVMELIRERKLFELQGNVLFIDPSICAALDDTTFAHLLHSIPAPELQEVSIYFNGCYALGPASVRSALEWCPTALFPSLQDCPQLYEGEIRLRDGRSLVHKALLQRCPVLHAELEKGLTLRRSEWAIVDHYLRMGNCKGAEQSISAFKAFSSIGSTELMESYGKELCETFLEDCWKFPITSERVLYAIDLTRLSIQWRLQTLYDSLAAYLSHCIGESFEFGEVATPGELVEGELLLLRQILDVLPTFYLSALSEELPCEKSPYKVIHKSRLEERLYIVYWLKRNAPNLDTFCIDPLQTRSQMERQMQLLTEHFPEMRIVRATHGCLVFDKYSMRTCLIGTAFSTDFQDTKEQKQGKSS